MAMHTKWDDDCKWPRRLLHVESLTSHPWQPGNIYGGHFNPRYNAISYTWGRFELRDPDQYPDVGPLPILGTIWQEYLPRIDPTQFTTSELLHIVRTAAGYSTRPVDFVWLDVACINQTPDSDEMDSEIGRQVKIFRGANDVFVWLTGYTCASVYPILHRTAQSHEDLMSSLMGHDSRRDGPAPGSIERHRIQCVENLAGLLQEFVQSPWFTSLWTLQEAFLSPRSILLFKDGLTEDLLSDFRDGGGNLVLPRLDSWVQGWNSILSITELRADYIFTAYRRLEAAVRNVGFIEGVFNQSLTFQLNDLEFPLDTPGNPFMLLASSTSRRPVNVEDTIYGIMQVFDVHVGKAAAPGRVQHITFDELRVEFAAAILKKYPIFSQLVVQHESCPRGETWMVHPTIKLTEYSHRLWNHQAFGGEILTRVIMDTAMNGGHVWGRFHGPTTELQTWYSTMLQATKDKRILPWSFSIDLDESFDQDLRRSSAIGDLHRCYHGNVDILSLLLTKWPTLRLLHLGTFRPPPALPLYCPNPSLVHEQKLQYVHSEVTLLLYPMSRNSSRSRVSSLDGLEYYQRIGFLTWDLKESSIDYHHWRENDKGLFG